MIEPCSCQHRESWPLAGGLALASEESVAHLTTECRRVFRAEEAAGVQRSAYHEAGHAVAAAALGYRISKVTIGGDPHIILAESQGADESLAASMIIRIAGEIGEGVFSHVFICPSADEMREKLAQARASCAGECDRCAQARMLVAYFSADAEDALIASWRGMWRLTLDLFDGHAWRGAVMALAQALVKRVVLCGDDVAEIVADFALATDMDAAFVRDDLLALLPSWRARL